MPNARVVNAVNTAALTGKKAYRFGHRSGKRDQADVRICAHLLPNAVHTFAPREPAFGLVLSLFLPSFIRQLQKSFRTSATDRVGELHDAPSALRARAPNLRRDQRWRNVAPEGERARTRRSRTGRNRQRKERHRCFSAEQRRLGSEQNSHQR